MAFSEASMAKYSTGGSITTDSGDQCEACGDETASLTEVTIEGANLFVCSKCMPHDDSNSGRRQAEASNKADRKRETVEKATNESATLWDGETSRWEQDGAGYTDDQLPHLVSNYGVVLMDARKEADMGLREVAMELDIRQDTVTAIECGNALEESVGGSVIADLEELFDIELSVQ